MKYGIKTNTIPANNSMEVYMCTDGLWDGVEDKKPSRLLKDAKTHIKSSKESSSPTGGKVGRKGEKS